MRHSPISALSVALQSNPPAACRLPPTTMLPETQGQPSWHSTAPQSTRILWGMNALLRAAETKNQPAIYSVEFIAKDSIEESCDDAPVILPRVRGSMPSLRAITPLG